MRAASAVILEYGKRPPNRWRRLARWTIVAVLLVTLAFAGLFALRNLAVWVARRQGVAAVSAWYQQARTAVIPAGTLLYSERAEDAGPTPETAPPAVGAGPTSYRITLAGQHSSLRQIVYDAQGVPRTTDAGVLYAHEHAYWAVPAGTRASVLCVRYVGLDPQRRPQFFATAYFQAVSTQRNPFPTMGSTTSAEGVDGRSLANLRIFAGAPHATDRTRFSLPFDCDGGRGRFEFQTDVDVSDGGRVAPSVRIEWDDAATQPVTQPGDADAR